MSSKNIRSHRRAVSVVVIVLIAGVVAASLITVRGRAAGLGFLGWENPYLYASGAARGVSSTPVSLTLNPLSDFVVTKTADTNAPTCVVGDCSLREAINAANADNDTSTINFNIPETDGGFADGVFTIQPTSALPTITTPITIDGTSQDTFGGNTNPNGPDVVINGSLAGASVSGFYISGDSTTIKGLVVNGFAGTGIAISYPNDSTPSNHQVLNNYVGTNAAGTAAVPNGGGGVDVHGYGSPSSQALNNTISGNLISGNTGTGIGLCDAGSTTISGNLIGTDAGGTLNLGNSTHGINLQCTGVLNSTISNNTIAFNGGDGFHSEPDYRSGNYQTGNKLTQNSIFENGGLGINLLPPPFGTVDGVTPNDTGDGDTGANNLQNFPVITSSKITGTTKTIKGTLNSIASSSFTVEFFANGSCDGSGNGEGKTYLGFAPVTTDGSGNGSFTFSPGTLTLGDVITATAMDASGNTSEFSACFTTIAGTPGTLQFSAANANDTELNASTHLVTVTVTRTGGSDGDVSVHYATSDGTATAGSDYDSASGYLNWLEDDGTGKSFDVTIRGDATYEGNETVNLTLSNAQVAALGSPSTATITVVNDDAPPATLVVNTTDDADDGICNPTHCSLREAINAANFNAVANTIDFEIPSSMLSGGVYTIQPTSALPTITTPITIDGTSQDTFGGNTNPNGPDVVINGSLAGASVSGFYISGDSTTIKGLVVNGFAGTGIAISYPNDSTPSNHQVLNNYVGTNAAGTAAVPNGGGGVDVHGYGSPSSQALNNTISGNLISGNTGTGIGLCDAGSTTISGNLIGTDAGGTLNLGNSTHGINLQCTGVLNSTISNNTIAFNGGDGFHSEPDYRSGNYQTGNKLTQNSIFENGGLGINLLPPPFGTVDGVTPNDTGDGDTGANNLQNFPVITSSKITGTTKTIKGTLNSIASSSFTVEFFANGSCDGSGNGEGKTYLGFAPVTTDGSGNGSFTFHPTSLAVGDIITATATDASNNTSEFSACFTTIAGTPGTLQFSLATYSVAENVGGGLAQITVTRAGGSDGDVSARFDTSNGTATAGSDYTAVTNYTVTFLEGDTTPKTIDITITNDSNYEANETVNLALSNPSVASLGAPATATLTITNDDAPPVMLVVNTTDDADDGICNATHCSLREAINAANFNAVANTIEFNIPIGMIAGGVYTIQPGSALATITTPMTIDGTSQTSFGGDTNLNGPEIVINGSSAGAVSGFFISGDNNTIKGLVINGFNGGGGIAMSYGADNTPSNNQILNNYIGTNAAGTAAVPNVGGGVGIHGYGSPSSQASNNTVQGNLISGNTGDGVGLCDASGTTISGNYIGTNSAGSNLGNSGHGITFVCAGVNDNTISGNTIAFNGGDGIFDQPDYGYGTGGHVHNKFTQNSIYSNTGLGINLIPAPGTVDGVTLNDALDGDPSTGTAPNNLQNFPDIAGASIEGGTITISGNLNSTPDKYFTVDFYANETCNDDAPNNLGHGEGQTYIGSLTSIHTDGTTGNAPLIFSGTMPVGAGTIITATATDSNGNTSEFSQCFAAIVLAPLLSVSKSSPSPSLVVGQNSTYTITVTNSGNGDATSATVKDAIPDGLDLISASGTNWTCTPSSGSDPVGTITCTFLGGTIGLSGGTSTIDIVVKPVTGTAGNTVTNRYSVDPSGGATAPDPTLCTAAETPSAGCGEPVESTIATYSDLTITKSDSPDPVSQGNFLTYTITVTNSSAVGTATATGVSVTDTLPTSVTFVSASPPCSYSAGTVTCSGLADIAPGGSDTVTIVVIPNSDGSITNNASVSASNDPNATAIAPKTDSEDTQVNAAVCTTEPSGMVAWYPGDGNADDIKGSNNGTLQNGATFAPGKVDQAFSLDGSNQYVNIASAATLPATFTFDAWVNPTSLAGAPMVFSKDDGLASGHYFQIESDGKLVGSVRSAGGFTQYRTNTPAVVAGRFQHIAMTYDGGAGADQKMTFYVDGVNYPALHLSTYDNGGTPLAGPGSARIGIFVDGTLPFAGLIDEFEQFDGVLTPTEIANIYNASFAGKCRTCTTPPTGMVSWWPAENNANDVAGQNNGTFAANTYAAGKVGQAFSLNGTDAYVQVPDSPSLHVGTGEITIDAWINAPAGNTPRSIVDKSGSGPNYPDYLLTITDDNKVEFFANDCGTGACGFGTTELPVRSLSVVADGTFHHVAGVRRANGDREIWVDGVRENTRNENNGNTDSSGPVIFGLANGVFFNGLIDEVEIFNRALSPGEITAIADAGNAGKCHTSTIQFSSATYSVTEGNTNATITVTRTGAHDTSATVHYASTNTGSATAGTDYDAVSNDLTFAPGEVTKTFDVPIHDDSTFEGPETVDLELSAVTGAGASLGTPSTATLTISDDADKPSFTIDDVSHNEGNSSGTTSYLFTVTKTGSTALDSSVQFNTMDGTALIADADYAANSGTLTFGPTVTTMQITVLVTRDDKYEANEAFTVNLHDAVDATISDANGTGTITNDDAPPSFTIDDVTHNEGDAGTTSYVFTVTKTGAAALSSSVDFTTQDGTATLADSDYQTNSGTLTFGATEPTKQITVLVNGDNKFETGEAFTVNLHDAVDATISDANGTGTITNDDAPPSFSIDDVTHNEGDAGTTSYVFTVTKTGATALSSSVNFATQDGTATLADSDYQTNSGTLTFGATEPTKQITVLVNGDNKFEAGEAFKVHLSGESGATISDPDGTGTITNDDPIPAISIDDVTLSEGNDPDTTGYTFTVSLSNPSYQTITVDYATANDTAVAPADYVAVSATTVTFNPGETTKILAPITVNGDSLYELPEQFFVNLSNVTGTATITSGNDGQGVGTILNDDPKPSLSINDRNNFEGTVSPSPSPSPGPPVTTTQTFTVTKTGSTAVSATVKFDTVDGAVNGATGGASCTTGVDYISQSGTLTFPASGTGSTTQTITVVVCKDSDFEPDETFTIDLSLPTNALISDNQGVGTIKNDDIPTAGFVVNSTDDTNDFNCNSAHCSLREAINAANSAPTAVAINFAIPDDDHFNLSGSRHFYYANDGVQGTLGAVTQTTLDEATIVTIADPDWSHSWWSILPTSQLPAISQQVFIEGYTQPGASARTLTDGAVLRIELDGESAGTNVTGLTLTGGSSTVRGLAINRFQRDGGAGTPAGIGIDVRGSLNTVAGCFIGTDVSGTLDQGNGGSGISLGSGGGHTVGGTTPEVPEVIKPEAVNLISGNAGDGITVTSTSNLIQGNLIGTSRNATDALGNGGSGISFSGAGFNTVGIDTDIDASTVAAEGNTIAFNTGDGVRVTSGIANSIRGNSIFSNGTTANDLGIDLGTDGLTPNDDQDPDTGPNDLQNFPVITLARVTGSTRTITVTLNSTVGETYTIDFYQSASCDTSGNGEGQTYLGSMEVTTDGTTDDGSFTFHPSVLTIGQVVTATATSAGTFFDTSEFSACTVVENGAPGAGDIQFTSATYTVAENVGNAAITLTRVGGTNGSVSTSFTTSGGTATAGSDYTPVNTTVTFNEGESSQTIDVPITDDSIYENNETVNLSLGTTLLNLTYGKNIIAGPDPHAAVLTITNDDAKPSFTINDVTHAEGNSGITDYTFTVTKTGSTQLNATVDYATAPGTATSPSDFAAIGTTTLTFLPADTSKQFTVQVNGDKVFEATDPETFFVNLSNASNATIADNQGIGTITNDDAQPAISITDKTQLEGNSGSANFDFAVTLSNPSDQTITVNYATVDGTATQPSDYTSTSGTLTFMPGDLSKTVNVSVNGDNVFEPDETFTVHLSTVMNATIADADGAGIIQNDEAARTLSIDDVSHAEGNSGTTTFAFTVTLSGQSSQTVTVDFATANGTATAGSDYVSNSGTLTFAPLETTKTINVSVNGDLAPEPNETFFVNLTNPSNATIADNQGLGTIVNDDVIGFQFEQPSYTVVEGTPSVSIVVKRTGDTSNAATVDYATNDFTGVPATDLQPAHCEAASTTASSKCDYATAGGRLRFAAGETSKTVVLSIVDDIYVEGDETLSMTLSNQSTGNLVSPSTTVITIQSNDTNQNATGNDNPYLINTFFVRQQYLDFLLREPDTNGFNDWVGVLNNCQPNQGGLGSDPGCDRVHVTSGFFRSPEFGERGYWVYRFFSASLGRRPLYAEFTPEMRRLSGLKPQADLDKDEADFINEFMQRPEFTNIYNGITDAGHASAFISKLEEKAGVTLPETVPPTQAGQPPQYGRSQLIGLMQNGTLTPAQTLRAFVEQKTVWDAYFFKAFVAMEYFGYLRRDPENAGYDDWVDVLTNGRGTHPPGDFRHLVFGFIYSEEYRERFGPK